MQTWVSSVPTTSSTGTTFPGEEGFATSGTSLGEVDVLLLVEVSGLAGREVDELVLAPLLAHPGARLVVGGKTAPVAPSSAIMFAIVPRSV